MLTCHNDFTRYTQNSQSLFQVVPRRRNGIVQFLPVYILACLFVLPFVPAIYLERKLADESRRFSILFFSPPLSQIPLKRPLRCRPRLHQFPTIVSARKTFQAEPPTQLQSRAQAISSHKLRYRRYTIPRSQKQPSFHFPLVRLDHLLLHEVRRLHTEALTHHGQIGTTQKQPTKHDTSTTLAAAATLNTQNTPP